MRILLFLFSLLAGVAHAETFYGRVVAISDGDTVTVLDESKRQRKIRLAGIDAPETRQPYGARSKRHLSEMVFGKEVAAECIKIDRYKREVCKILIRGVDANLELVKAGMAWWYRAYAKEQSTADQERYSAAENGARANRLGLWEGADAVAPWEWRREQRLLLKGD